MATPRQAVCRRLVVSAPESPKGQALNWAVYLAHLAIVGLLRGAGGAPATEGPRLREGPILQTAPAGRGPVVSGHLI